MTEERNTEISVRGAGRSIISYKFGGREYPLKTVARCSTCMSPFRFEIEEAIVSGRVYRRIQDDVALLCEGTDFEAPSIRSMTDHFTRGHMPLEMGDTRKIIEDRARRVGKRIEDSQEELVDGITLMETVMLKAFRRIASGAAEPSIRDGLAAAKLLTELGMYDGSEVDQQAYVEAFMAYHETAEQIMGPEEFKRFGDALASNPVLKALAARYDGEPEVVPGSVEEE